MVEKINILDCTLRDGGYYNNWNFKNSLVKKYITAMSEAKIDVVEIGFRFLSQEKSLGSFAYSADEYIKTLSLPSSLDIAVMINAKEIIESELGVKAYHIVPFRKNFLLEYAKWNKGILEKIEFNEYLRILEKGYKIKAVHVESDAVSVDTEADLEYAREKMPSDSWFLLYD